MKNLGFRSVLVVVGLTFVSTVADAATPMTYAAESPAAPPAGNRLEPAPPGLAEVGHVGPLVVDVLAGGIERSLAGYAD